jgi:ABC-type lipoprotein export system ATPase subunit
MTGGYGNSGVPDIVACYEGFFVAVECKAGKGKPTLLQLDNLKRIDASGGFSVVVNESNVEQLRELIQSWVNTVGIKT